MPQKLSTLCLKSLCDYIQDHHHSSLAFLSPNLRERLLDLVLMGGGIQDPTAISSLTTPEFLSGLSQIKLQQGQIDDHEYLDRVADRLAIVQVDSETIGSGVIELKLNLYGVQVGCLRYPYPEYAATNLTNIVRLVSRCLNLKKLHLQIIKGDEYSRSFDAQDMASWNMFNPRVRMGLLNRLDSTFDAWWPVLENVEELKICAVRYREPPPSWLLMDTEVIEMAPYLISGPPIIHFRRLTSLHLEGSSVDSSAWRQLLEMVKGTLTHLEVAFMKLLPESNFGPQSIIPFPLPKLKSFKLGLMTLRSRWLFEILDNCQDLTNVIVHLDGNKEDFKLMQLLNRVKVDVQIHLNYKLKGDPAALELIFDEAGRFQLIDLFRSKVKGIHLRISSWNPIYSTAVQDLVAEYPDLTDLRLSLSPWLWFYTGEFASIFQDPCRASKLSSLTFGGSVDSEILTSIFENCVFVRQLDIFSENLTNDHLILWASRGARPKVLKLRSCPNISDEGLVPLLKSSGDELEVFECNSRTASIKTWETLIEYCRFVTYCAMPIELQSICRSKVFCGRQLKFAPLCLSLARDGQMI